MIETYDNVANLSKEKNITYRMAAYLIALNKINSVYEKRGRRW